MEPAFDHDDAPWPDAPAATHTARATFRALVADVVARAKAILPAAVNGRVEKATKLVLQHDVRFLEDGTVEVGSSSDPMKVYRLQGTACTCQDFTSGKAPEGWCQHRIAAGIHKRVEQVLAAQVQAAAGDETALDLVAVMPAALVAHGVATHAALPEARSNANVRLTIAGRDVQVTLRDDDEGALLERLTRLLERYPAPASAPDAPAPTHAASATPVCAYHGAMKPSTKAAGTFYCPSKMGDGTYCKERWPKA